MLETAARAQDAVEGLDWRLNCHPIRLVIVQRRNVSMCSIRRTAVEKRELGTIRKRFNQPQGGILTLCEPQMNMLQDGDGHLNQTVALRIELNESVAAEGSTEVESWQPLPYPYYIP